MSRCPLLAFASVLAAALPAAAGPVIDDPRFGFRLTLPNGFEPVPDRVAGDIIHAYVRPAANGGTGVAVFVERMRGTIGREKLDPPPGRPVVTVFTERWKDFDLDVIRVPESAGGADYLTFNTQVPLAGEAIQLKVFGPAADEAELRALTRTLLAGLDGRSNWLTGEERIGRGLTGVLELGLFLGGVAGVAALIIYSIRQGRARKRHLRERRADDGDRPRRGRRPAGRDDG